MLLKSSCSSTLASVAPSRVNTEEPVIHASLRPLIVSFNPSVRSSTSSFVDSADRHQGHATFCAGAAEQSRDLNVQGAPRQQWPLSWVRRAKSDSDIKSLVCGETAASAATSSSFLPARIAASSRLICHDQKARDQSRRDCKPFRSFYNHASAFSVAGDKQNYSILEEEMDNRKPGDFSSYEGECGRIRVNVGIRTDVDRAGGSRDCAERLYCVVDGGGDGDHGGGGKPHASKCSGFGGGAEDVNLTHLYYQKMVLENPGNPLLLRNYAQYLAEAKRDYEKAEEYYARAILASPMDGELLAQYAGIVWKIHRDHDRAASYFQRAVQAAPEDSHVVAARAAFLWDMEEEEEENTYTHAGVAFPNIASFNLI